MMQKISQNGTMYQQIQMMQQQMLQLGAMVDQAHGSNDIVAGLMQQFGMQGQPMPSSMGEPINIEGNTGESSVTKKARAEAAARTTPT